MRKRADRSQKPEVGSQKAGRRIPARLSSERGIALVLTLGILVLVTMLVIAFAVSMRVENTASKNFNDLIRARQLAQGAVDDAVAQIRAGSLPSTTTRAWVAVPGAIISTTGGGVFNTNLLYTVASPPGSGAIDLNSGFSITGKNTFYTSFANSAITASWQNVTTIIGGATELQGRFAYWTDVEASKVNINIANKRDPALVNQSLPSDVDLRAMENAFYNSDPIALAFVNERSTAPLKSWYSTLEEMRRGFPSLPTPVATLAAYQANKFFATVGTSDTNTDAFGRGRIDVTKITSAVTPEYTDAYNRMTDDVWARVLYPSAVTDATRNTLQKKYGEYGARQILANIIEYQNPTELSVPVGNTTLDANGLPPDYSGLKKCPMITDVIAHVAIEQVPNAGMIDLVLHVFVDVRLINIYEVDRGIGYQVLVDPLSVKYTPTGGASTDMIVSEQLRTLTKNVSAQSYGLLGASSGAPDVGTHPPPEWTATIPGTIPAVAPTVDNVTIVLKRVRLLNTVGNPNTIVDWMSPDDFNLAYPSGIVFLPAKFVPYTKLAGVVTSPAFVSANPTASFQPIGLQKLDPRTRTFSGSLSRANGGPSFALNWRPLSDAIDTQSGNPTWSSATLGVTRDFNAPNSYKLLADVRYMEPNPIFAGTGSGTVVPTLRWLGNYKEGPIQSLGELTYIHTGYPFRTIRFRSIVPVTSGLSSATTYADANATDGGFGDRNTPLGLQNVERDAIPDWILLDAFNVGSEKNFSGRINVNTRFSGCATALRPRTVPLAALINNTSAQLSTTFDTDDGTNIINAIGTAGIAYNMANHLLTANSPYISLPAYLTPGEICEVRDLEYFHDTVSATAQYNDNPSKTRRQQLIRRISNLVTARSNVFTIWAVAQSIKDVDKNGNYDPPPAGNDFVSGEVKVQAIVERYEEPPGTVKFRTKYFRYIYE